MKEKLLNYLWKILNDENDMKHRSMKTTKGYPKFYKFYVGKGNNSEAIKAIMNQRHWWQAHTKEDINELNFLWTQWRLNRELDKLPSKIPKPAIENVVQECSEEENEGEGRVCINPKYVQMIDVEHSLPHKSKKLYNRIE